jgi:hypothetical protein
LAALRSIVDIIKDLHLPKIVLQTSRRLELRQGAVVNQVGEHVATTTLAAELANAAGAIRLALELADLRPSRLGNRRSRYPLSVGELFDASMPGSSGGRSMIMVRAR